MEYVEGPTLAERITQGAMSMEEALPVAEQIAEALQAAHEQGIVHRDLKPANVKLRPDGVVKVLDFGLAKLAQSLGADHVPQRELTMSPTITTPAMTQVGVILGTAAYMAPEQARGRPTDARADIWAFGVVLYEMLTGRRPFQGDDITETIAAVVKERPDLTRVPTRVRRLLEACFEKDPRKRLQAIGDMRLLLEAEPSGNIVPARPWIQGAALVVASVASLSAAILAVIHFRETSPPQIIQSTILPPENATFDFTQGAGLLALSPDGRHVVFSARTADGRTLHCGSARSMGCPRSRLPGLRAHSFRSGRPTASSSRSSPTASSRRSTPLAVRYSLSPTRRTDAAEVGTETASSFLRRAAVLDRSCEFLRRVVPRTRSPAKSGVFRGFSQTGSTSCIKSNRAPTARHCRFEWETWTAHRVRQ